jgi:hypothetical protein
MSGGSLGNCFGAKGSDATVGRWRIWQIIVLSVTRPSHVIIRS